MRQQISLMKPNISTLKHHVSELSHHSFAKNLHWVTQMSHLITVLWATTYYILAMHTVHCTVSSHHYPLSHDTSIPWETLSPSCELHCFKFRRIFRQIDVVRRGTSANRRKYSGIFFRCICVFFPVAFRVQQKFPVQIFHDMFCFCCSVKSFCRRTVWNTALES